MIINVEKKLVEYIEALEQENKKLKEQKKQAIDKIKNTHIFGMRCGKTYLIKFLNELLEILGGEKE